MIEFLIVKRCNLITVMAIDKEFQNGQSLLSGEIESTLDWVQNHLKVKVNFSPQVNIHFKSTRYPWMNITYA